MSKRIAAELDTRMPGALQKASLDIWDKRYRLKNIRGAAREQCIDDTFKRVAKALASLEVESSRECTTFRFNPEISQGVLVRESELEKTRDIFTLKNGEVLECKGNDDIEYEGQNHSAANLYDAIKEGYYGKLGRH